MSSANSGCEVPAKTIIPRWSIMANQQDKSTRLSVAKYISGLLGIPFCHFCSILRLVPCIDQTFVNKGSACCCLILAMACLLGLNKSRNYNVKRRKPLLTANEQGRWRLWRRYFLLQLPPNLLKLGWNLQCNYSNVHLHIVSLGNQRILTLRTFYNWTRREPCEVNIETTKVCWFQP